MGYCKHVKGWACSASAISIIAMLLISCQTNQRSAQTEKKSADIQILNRIARDTSRYRSALDLTGSAQSTVERSLAERHWRINRDILKLEFAQVNLEIEDLISRGKNDMKANQPEAIPQQDQKPAEETEKIHARVERVQQRVAAAERRLKESKSDSAKEQAQAELKRARQRLEIAQIELDLSESNRKLAEIQRKELSEAPEEIKSLKDKISLLEKDILGKDGAETSPIKWVNQENARGAGLMGAISYWWGLHDKGQVLDRAEQRANRMLNDFKSAQSESQKLQSELQTEHRALNRQMRQLYRQANELLSRPEQSENASKLLKQADAKMNESLALSQRRERESRMQEILQQKVLLASEDADSLTTWIQVVADSRARALTRLVQRLGWLLGILFVVFLSAYFVKKIPGRYVKEEKSAFYFRKLIGFVAWLIVILIVIFNAAGGIGSISAVIGLAGAGLAIALQDPIVSLVGWFLIIGKYGISVGDRIEINGVKGDVADVGMLRTAIMEVGNWLSGEQSTGRMVFFPNSFVFKGHFFNYSTSNSFIWDEIHVLVTYESSWKKALDIILKVAEEASMEVVARAKESQQEMARKFNVSLGNPDAHAHVTIADSGVDLVLRFLTEIKLRRIMRDRICRGILEAFEKEEDIQLAYPTQRQLTETRIINAPVAGQFIPE